MAVQAKTVDDLPHFRVREVKQNQSNRDYFELVGTLDRTSGVVEGRCSLLFPFGGVLTALPAYLESLDLEDKTARIHASSKGRPEVLDLVLAYLHPQWDPLHVWMVALPTWTWNRSLFQATDATSERVKGNSPQILDGEEIHDWIKIKEEGKSTGLSRYYPVFPSGRTTLPRIEPDGVIKGGWNHTDCELCRGHIDAGQYGYTDPSQHWVCETCYERYVAYHDLSFMFAGSN